MTVAIMARPRSPIGSYGKITVDAVKFVPGPQREGKPPRKRIEVVDSPERGHSHWRARTRYRFEDGTLRQVERFASTSAKAENVLKKALTTIQATSQTEVKRETRVKDLGERFLASKAGRAPRTLESYEHTVRKVIYPRIGELAISEATAERLQRFLDQVQVENGPGAAKNARAMLSGMMGLAVRSDALKTNPVRELSQIEAKPTGATAIPLTKLAPMLEAVRNDPHAIEQDIADLIEFLAGTGVRISEAIGLDWDDYHADLGEVVIRKSKTEAGERRITIPANLVELLNARERRGPAIFSTPLGKRRDRRNTSGQWQEARERLNLPDYTFHSFRKTVATALDQAGLTPRDIAEYLGHANPSLTMNTYMSKTVGGSKAAEALQSLMQVRS